MAVCSIDENLLSIFGKRIMNIPLFKTHTILKGSVVYVTFNDYIRK